MDNAKTRGARERSTQRFLIEYELRKTLERSGVEDIDIDSTPADDVAARAECAGLVSPFDGDVAARQVRVLSGVKNLTYVLVAREWEEGSWLVIPFSSFSAPATEAELKMKVDGGLGLRVVQLWNARSLLTVTIAKSWLVHTLPEDDVADVLSAWQWSVGIGDLSEDQLVRTGMPITNRRDPRIEYQDAALANFAKLDAEDLLLADQKDLIASVREDTAGRASVPFIGSPVFEQEEQEYYDIAAAGKVQPVAADCKVGGVDVRVHLRYAPDEKELRLRVFAPDGSRSRSLDGWSVFGSGAILLGSVDGADFVCKFHERFDGVVDLVDKNGAVHPLVCR